MDYRGAKIRNMGLSFTTIFSFRNLGPCGDCGPACSDQKLLLAVAFGQETRRRHLVKHFSEKRFAQDGPGSTITCFSGSP